MYKTQKFPKNFKYLVTCPCCDVAKFSTGVLNMLIWASQFGEIFVTSFYRCDKYNKELYKKIGDLPTKSRHSTGEAVDFFIKGISLVEMFNKLDDKYKTSCGIGIYLKRGIIHFDIRRNKARWNG